MALKVEKVIIVGYSSDDLQDKLDQYPEHDIITVGGDRDQPLWAVLRRYAYEDNILAESTD